MRFAVVCVACLALCACDGTPMLMGFHPPPPPPAMCPAATSTIVCEGTVATTCNGGTAGDVVDCNETMRVCVSGVGCASCLPHAMGCDGESITVCRADGSGSDPIFTCDPATTGQHCSPTGCVDLCAAAAAARSYIGCEYLAVPTFNPVLAPEFDFAIAVANPNLVAADVALTQNGAPVTGVLDDGSSASSVSVPPGGVQTIRLPWITALTGQTTDATKPSALLRGAAYRVVSSVPVLVDQFNPLEFRIPRDCAHEPDSTSDHQCFSYSNDASLLLPTTALTGSYVAVSRAALLVNVGTFRSGNGGFVAVVGADDVASPVTITTHAYVEASSDGTSVRAMAPGDTATFMLAKGDVLQLVGHVPSDCPTSPEQESSTLAPTDTWYCDLGADYDLTGTEIRTPGHVEVISGHGCDFVPFDRWACDHLEEQMFPVETWDSETVVPLAKAIRGEPDLVRVLASADGTVVTFDPPSVSGPLTLDRFAYADVTTTTDVRITATHPIEVAQFLVGQNYSGFGRSGAGASGDPSMGMAVPSAEERPDYVFLVPATYQTNYADLTAPAGAFVTMDGVRITTWRQVGSSGTSTATVQLRGGVHHAIGDRPFALIVYGYAQYTSYLYTGGLDFRVIGSPI